MRKSILVVFLFKALTRWCGIKIKLFLVFVLAFAGSLCVGQTFISDNPEYKERVEEAYVYLEEGNCKKCAKTYKKAFKLSDRSMLSHLRAALCAEQCGKQKLADKFLNHAASIEWDRSIFLFDHGRDFEGYEDSDLRKRLVAFSEIHQAASGINPKVYKEIQEIGEADQRHRGQMRVVPEKYGRNSKEMSDLWRNQNALDSVNQIRVVALIEEYGYPGKSLVGASESSTAFMVIQHAPLEMQEAYLPMLKEAADAEELQWSALALLIDRIETRNGREQIYGSQVRTDPETGKPGFYPIKDRENVDKRRAEVGLPSLEEYAKFFGIELD